MLEDVDKLCNITCICYVCARFNQGSTQPRRSNSIAIYSHEIVVSKDNLAQKCHVVEIIDVIYD